MHQIHFWDNNTWFLVKWVVILHQMLMKLVSYWNYALFQPDRLNNFHFGFFALSYFLETFQGGRVWVVRKYEFNKNKTWDRQLGTKALYITWITSLTISSRNSYDFSAFTSLMRHLFPALSDSVLYLSFPSLVTACTATVAEIKQVTISSLLVLFLHWYYDLWWLMLLSQSFLHNCNHMKFSWHHAINCHVPVYITLSPILVS